MWISESPHHSEIRNLQSAIQNPITYRQGVPYKTRMMTFYSLSRLHKALIFNILTLGWLSPNLHAQIACPTIMPRSIPLSICSQADSLSFVYTNNSQNQRVGTAKATIELPYGTKLRYRAGSVKGRSGAGSVTENNIADLNKPIFTIPIPNYLEGVTVTFAVDVSCEALDLARAALPMMRITMDYTGAFNPAASPLLDKMDSEPFNIQSAILTITPDMATRSLTKDSPFNRCFTLRNTGYGSVDRVYLYDTTAVGANFISATIAGAAATPLATENITWNGKPATITKWVISGAALGSDGILSPNETVDICENMMLADCGSFKTRFRVEYKCSENAAPCSTATGNTTIDTDPGVPAMRPMVLNYEKPNGCPTRHVRMSFLNNGTAAGANTGQATNIALYFGFLVDSTVSIAADVPITNVRINGVALTTTIWSGVGIKVDMAQLATDPDGAGGLMDLNGDGKFNDMLLGDSLIVEFDYAPFCYAGRTSCESGFKDRQLYARADFNNKCFNTPRIQDNTFFNYRNILLSKAVQTTPEPVYNSNSETHTFKYRFFRDIRGYDFTGATAIFKIAQNQYFQIDPNTVKWNGVALSATAVGDTLYVNISNVANYLNGELAFDAINSCDATWHPGQTFSVKYDMTWGGCANPCKQFIHCDKQLIYSGNWGCGNFCYVFDPVYADWSRTTQGFTDRTETTQTMQSPSVYWMGDQMKIKNRIHNDGDITGLGYNPNNLVPGSYIQFFMGNQMWRTDPLVPGQYMASVDYVKQYGSMLLFKEADIRVTGKDVNGNPMSFTRHLTPADLTAAPQEAIKKIKNDAWEKIRSEQGGGYISYNYRDTVIDNICYDVLTIPNGPNTTETHTYFAYLWLGPNYPNAQTPAGFSYEKPFEMFIDAIFEINQHYKPRDPNANQTTAGVYYQEEWTEYLTYPAIQLANQGFVLDHSNPVAFYKRNFGAVCGIKYPPQTWAYPKPHIDRPKKSYNTLCNNTLEHEMGYNTKGEQIFVNEFRAPHKINNFKVTIPTGYRVKVGTTQYYTTSDGIGAWSPIADPSPLTGQAVFTNTGNWPLTDDGAGYLVGSTRIKYEIEPTGALAGATFQIPYEFNGEWHHKGAGVEPFVLRDTFTLSDKEPVFAATSYDLSIDNKHCTPNRTLDFKFNNHSDVPMLNTYIAFEGNAGLVIDSIQNVTTGSPLIATELKSQPVLTQNVYGTDDRFAQIGVLRGQEIAVYRVYYHSSSCGKDSIKSYIDWGCAYPANNQPNLASTHLQTATGRIAPTNPGLQAVLLTSTTDITLCDDVTYEFEFKNTQLSDAYNVNLKAMLPPGMRYIANSAQFKLPANAGTYTNFAAGDIAIVNAGTSDSLVLKLNQFDSPTNSCGLKTAADTANSKIRVQFKANYTTCPPPMATRTAKFYTSATNFCKDTTLLYNMVSKPIHFTDEDPQVRNSLACTVVTMPTINGSSASAQQLTCTFKVKNEGLGGTTIGKDSIQINLPKGLTYSSTANVSGLALPTTPRIVNGSDGQTLMYLLPAGMAVGAETQFNLVVTTDPSQLSGHCNQNVPIAMRTLSYKSPICAAKNLTCDGANQGCEIQGSAFNDANIFCCPVICLPVVARRN
jgi:uncharacterized repeat protein (TIGR01451 family)